MLREKTARGIIEVKYDNKECIVFIKRQKFKDGKMVKEYYTLPGGHVEENETFETTLIREIQEELNITVSIKEKILTMYNEDLNRDEKFYLCDQIGGMIKPGNGPEWTNPNIEKYGSYEIVYIDVNEMQNYPIFPEQIKNILIKRYEKN